MKTISYFLRRLLWWRWDRGYLVHFSRYAYKHWQFSQRREDDREIGNLITYQKRIDTQAIEKIKKEINSPGGSGAVIISITPIKSWRWRMKEAK